MQMTGLIRGMTGKSTFELRWKASSYNYSLKHGIRNPESGNGNGITETETEYGICERRFQAIDLKEGILAMTMK